MVNSLFGKVVWDYINIFVGLTMLVDFFLPKISDIFGVKNAPYLAFSHRNSSC
jgi:hypothetical protein